MYDIFKEKARIWNIRLKQCIKDKYNTQTKFAEKLSEQKDQFEMSVNQEMVSRWMRVGDKSGKGNETIGFPKYKNMICIAKCLGVDVGYLTGETDAETFTLEKASELLNLDTEVLKLIIKITGKERSCIEWGHQSENYKKILNNFLTSEKFLDIMKIMLELDTSYNQKNTEMEELQNELGDELFNKSINLYQSDYINLNLTQEECEAIAKIDNVIDNCHEKNLIFQREIAFNRFKLQEAFTLLLNELYPNKEY